MLASSPPKGAPRGPASKLKGKAIRTVAFGPDTNKDKITIKPALHRGKDAREDKRVDEHKAIIKNEIFNVQKRYLTPSDSEDGSSLRSDCFSPIPGSSTRHAGETISPTQFKRMKIESDSIFTSSGGLVSATSTSPRIPCFHSTEDTLPIVYRLHCRHDDGGSSNSDHSMTKDKTSHILNLFKMPVILNYNLTDSERASIIACLYRLFEQVPEFEVHSLSPLKLRHGRSCVVLNGYQKPVAGRSPSKCGPAEVAIQFSGDRRTGSAYKLIREVKLLKLLRSEGLKYFPQVFTSSPSEDFNYYIIEKSDTNLSTFLKSHTKEFSIPCKGYKSKTPIDTRFFQPNGIYTSEIILSIFRDICFGLYYMHTSYNIAHGDLCPENIQISLRCGCQHFTNRPAPIKFGRYCFQVQLSGFGKSKVPEENNGDCKRQFYGNSVYAPPETWKFQQDFDRLTGTTQSIDHNQYTAHNLMEADMWAAGGVLYSMLTRDQLVPFFMTPKCRSMWLSQNANGKKDIEPVDLDAEEQYFKNELGVEAAMSVFHGKERWFLAETLRMPDKRAHITSVKAKLQEIGFTAGGPGMFTLVPGEKRKSCDISN